MISYRISLRVYFSYSTAQCVQSAKHSSYIKEEEASVLCSSPDWQHKNFETQIYSMCNWCIMLCGKLKRWLWKCQHADRNIRLLRWSTSGCHVKSSSGREQTMRSPSDTLYRTCNMRIMRSHNRVHHIRLSKAITKNPRTDRRNGCNFSSFYASLISSIEFREEYVYCVQNPLPHVVGGYTYSHVRYWRCMGIAKSMKNGKWLTFYCLSIPRSRGKIA